MDSMLVSKAISYSNKLLRFAGGREQISNKYDSIKLKLLPTKRYNRQHEEMNYRMQKIRSNYSLIKINIKVNRDSKNSMSTIII